MSVFGYHFINDRFKVFCCDTLHMKGPHRAAAL